MRCTIENKHLKGLRAICEQLNPGGSQGIGKTAPDGSMIRIEANGEKVNVESSSGGMSAASRIVEPGVVFISAQAFLEATADLHTNHFIEIEASENRVVINGRAHVPEWDRFKYFDDPETAPQVWVGE